MAASRVDSSRRLCVRYRKFFIAAGVTLGLQLFLCHYFLSINQRTDEDEFVHTHPVIIDLKETFTKQYLNKQDFSIIDKRISANGGKGPPDQSVRSTRGPPRGAKFRQQYNENIKDGDAKDQGDAYVNSMVEPKRSLRENGLVVPHNTNEKDSPVSKVPQSVTKEVMDNTVNEVPEEQQQYENAGNADDKTEIDNDNNNNVVNDNNNNVANAETQDHQEDDNSPVKVDSALTHKYIPKCNVSEKDVASAIKRAKTTQCKQEIADVYCQQQEGKLYNINLPNFCPTKGTNHGQYLGCHRDMAADRDLDGGMMEFADNTPQKCIEHCFRSALKYAGLQYSKECWCGSSFGKHSSKLEEAHCQSKCPGNASESCGAYLTNKIYATGVQTVIRQNAPLEHPPLHDATRVKVVFVLTLNGRAIRQVARLLRVIYSPDHYYYIHVDKRQEYLYRELQPLEKRLPNVFLTKQRFSTIWGGASLLQAHLSFLRELFDDRPEWKWDYYINLSESDYPIKPISQLVDYLTAYKGFNFLRSFGKNVPRFIKKQGMDQTFHECENHLWRVAKRPLPAGIIFDGGSDWIGLWWEFAHYAVYSTDELVTGLKQFYKYSLLPVESFFHMVLQNSQYCAESVDNNLHLTNWRRKQGCKCQYKHIVDWCGCSPNDIKISDMERLLHFDKKPMFFARKFEAIVDQEVINSVDISLHGYLYKGLPGLSSFWQNTYHHLDKATTVKDAALTIYSSIIRHTVDQLVLSDPTCDLKPFKLLEANVYNQADHFHGLLVLFSAQVKDSSKDVTLEVYVEPKRYYSVIDPKGGAGRLQSLEVGTDFDVKELIFRNYGNLMGPYDDISLTHEWGPSDGDMTVSIAWVDPTNEIAASYDVHIPSTHHVGNQKPTIKKPLRPGIWKANIMIDLKLVAETQFLVTPLTFYSNKPISVSEVLRSHQGPIGLYTSTDFSEFMPNLRLIDSPKLRQEAFTNSKKTGGELDQWVDSLTGLFWMVRDMCVVGTNKSCPSLNKCITSPWSSRSPDLKSDMKYIGGEVPIVR